jgi:hypothetical protein
MRIPAKAAVAITARKPSPAETPFLARRFLPFAAAVAMTRSVIKAFSLLEYLPFAI